MQEPGRFCWRGQSGTLLFGGPIQQVNDGGMADGVPACAWSLSAGTLPSGLTLNRATGVISGVPDAAGNYAFTVKVTDSSSTGGTTKALSIAVGSPLASSPVLSGPVVTAVVPVTGCRST